jgi:chromosome partitioning protein
MKIIALANQKGGVGKTTTAVNLAAGVAEFGKQVLLIDLDAQANASSAVGIESTPECSVYPVLLGERALSDQIRPTAHQRLSIVPAEMAMAGCEVELASDESRVTRLKRVFMEWRSHKPPYDYVFLDCPPSLGIMMTNALAAADEVLIPLQCEYFALEGLAKIKGVIEQIALATGNRELKTEGIVFTMYDARLRLSQQVVSDVRKYFPQEAYQTLIPRSVRLGEAPSHGETIFTFDGSGIAAQSFRLLAREFLDRHEGENGKT